MKKHFKLFSLFGLYSAGICAANNFTVSPKTSTFNAANCSATNTHYVSLNNLTSNILSLRWKIITNTLNNNPACWWLCWCDNGGCYTPLPANGAVKSNYLDPGMNSSWLELNPKANKGAGILQIEIYEASAPANKDTITITVNACPGGASCGVNAINENQYLDNGLSIYPIPAADVITIDVEDPAFNPGDIISLYNALGKVVMTFKLDEPAYKVNVALLPRGVYFVKYKNSFRQISTI